MILTRRLRPARAFLTLDDPLFGLARAGGPDTNTRRGIVRSCRSSPSGSRAIARYLFSQLFPGQTVKALHSAVGLRKVGLDLDILECEKPHQLLKLAGCELAPVIPNDLPSL